MTERSTFSSVTLAAGTQLYVVINASWIEPHRGYANPHERRFSPVREASGQVVPVLYAGDEPECALGETVFRDLRGGAPVPRQRLDGAALLTAVTETDLVLADLRSVAARAVGAHDDDWGGPPGAWAASHYERSQRWAQRIYDHAGAPTPSRRWHGIAWNSHQDLQQSAYLLFMDRETTLVPEGSPEPLGQPPWRAVVGDYATRLRTLLPISW